MTTSHPTETAAAMNVRITERSLIVELQDGRTLTVPLEWYPRLAEGSPRERRNWRLVGRGIGIHWPDLDEDISMEGLLQGLPSGESSDSLLAWRAARKTPTHKRLHPTAARVRERQPTYKVKRRRG